MFENWKWATVREHIAVPLLSRLGTFIASGLLAANVHGELAEQVALGAVAVGLVLFDLLVGFANRRAYAKRKGADVNG